MYLRSRSVWLFILVLLLSFDAIGAGLDARLDRTKVAEGETVLLTLSAPGEGTGVPDLTPLARDFDVLNQGQSTRLQIINGRTNSSRQWQITLAPKRTGRLRVPVLRLGKTTSEPLDLEVLPATQAAKTDSPRPVLLEVDASPDRPYVQGEVIYTVRLLSRVALRQASLTAPSAGDAIVEQMGEDRHYDTYRDGQSFHVIERRYAIFPQHSGELQLDPPLLTAQIPETGRRSSSLRERFFGGHDPFADFDRIMGNDSLADMGGIFEQTRTVQLRGRRLTLDVQPQPTGTPTPWLPAESLTMNESWSPSPPVFRVGEPVTRTIAITAQGVTAAQLPDITQATVPGINVYPDKAQVETHADGDTIVAKKVLKAALVPSRPGNFTLPPIDLVWWETGTDKKRVAHLPAHEIRVLPGVAAVTPSIPDSAQTTDLDVAAAAKPARPASKPTDTSGGTQRVAPAARWIVGNASGYWPWLTAVFALAWLFSTALWWRTRSAHRSVPEGDKSMSTAIRPDVGKVLQQLERAFSDDDARAARRLLLDWGAARWPNSPPRRLEAMAGRLPAEAANCLHELDRALYAGGGQIWSGAHAWGQLAPLLREGKQSGDRKLHDTPLPPLYPQGA